MSETDPAVPARSWRRSVVLALAVLAVVHSVAIALWLAPSGPVRQGVVTSGISSYVDPYFRQSWSNLQPSSQQVDETLLIRARMQGAGDSVVTTDWVNVVADGTAERRYDLAPGRANLSARRLATNVNAAMFRLDDEGRKLVAGDYATRSLTVLRDALEDAGVGENAIDIYMVDDQMATRFASLYAQARWDEEIVEVQYRSGYRRVPQRSGDVRIQDVEFTWFDHGWRKFYRGPAGARTTFRDWVGP
jgi:hypothetical protein